MIDKIYTLILVLIPMLNMYAVAGSIPLGTVVLFLYVIFMGIHGLIKKGGINISACYYFLPFLLYLIFNYITTLMLDIGLVSDITINTIHYIVFLFFCFFISQNHLVFPLAVKSINVISIISVIFANVQIIVYRATGIFIPGTIPGATLLSDMTNQLYLHISENLWAREDIRSHAFLSEPQHYCVYIAVSLAFYLFLHEKPDRHDWIGAAIISIGLITSRSTTGYIFLALLWGIRIWMVLRDSILKNKISVYIAGAIFVGLPAALAVILNSSYFKAMYDRTLGIGSSYSGIEGHFGNIDKVMDMMLESPYRFFFGYGMIEPEFYYTSLMKMLFSFGIIGTALLFTGIFIAMYRGNRLQRVIGIMILVNCVGGETLLNVPFCLIYFSLITINIKHSALDNLYYSKLLRQISS